MTKNIKQKIQKLRAFCEKENIAFAADNFEIYTPKSATYLDFLSLGGKRWGAEDRAVTENSETYSISNKSITRDKFSPYL